ncbi:MAG TPA: cation transporter [Candidatus Limnocylindria bacterium]|nr:cation transporter [Candidatus Limnocylindria bacterium]
MLTRDQLLRRAIRLSLLSILLGAFMGVTAVVAALTSGSLSLLGFGFDAAVDSAASMALVWRFAIETRQPDRADRVERTAEAVLGIVLLVVAVYLAFSAVRALLDNAHPDATPAGLVLLVASAVALAPLALAKYRTAAALASRALRADSILTGIAALLAVVSLVSLGLSTAFELTWADAIGALVVSVILVREGLGSLALLLRSRAAE